MTFMIHYLNRSIRDPIKGLDLRCLLRLSEVCLQQDTLEMMALGSSCLLSVIFFGD